MDISLNPRTIPPSATPASPATEPSSKPATDHPSLTITEARSSGADGVEAVPDSSLRRDDVLGRLFDAAFKLPPPPMPAFPS